MAVLGVSNLTGCSSIPNFIATGSRMVFEQTAAPTSWTKETDAAFSNVALQVVTGTASFGGQLSFPSVFPTTAKGVGAVPLVGPASLTVNASGPILAVQASPEGAGASYDSKTLTESFLRLHDHNYVPRGDALVLRNPAATQSAPDLTFQPAGNTGNTGGNGSHTHTIVGTHGPGNHSVSSGTHAHTVNAVDHPHIFTMTARDFDVNYMDVIICIKS